MSNKRKLSDLYVVGKELVLDDGKGEPITVWIQKLNPIEHERAMRRAGSARSRVLSGKDSIETEIATDEAAEYGRDGWIEYLASDALGRRMGVIEAELAAEEEWSKDNYLQGLKDQWETDAQQVLIDDPEDPQALNVREQLKRFTDEVQKRIDGEREQYIKDFEAKPDEDLERRVVDRLISTRADLAWLTEFRRSEVWLSVRDPEDHRKYLFEEREDVDALSQKTLIELMTTYQDLAVEPLEGKSSGATLDSSKSSESPEKEETEDSSGPEVVTT